MSKGTEAARRDGKTAGKTAKNNTRIDCWRRVAAEHIAKLEAIDRSNNAKLRTSKLRLCAKAEGTTPAELVVRLLKSRRLNGAKVTERPEDCFSPEFRAWEDTVNESARRDARERHLKSVVHAATVDWLGYCFPHGLTAREDRTLIDRFYRIGDMGLRNAFERMTRAALAPASKGGAA